jgi:F-type H+-transporting ATPase subunit gamma
MANTKVIKQKIKAITSIKKITKTMEMVSVSKMKKSVKETLDMQDYVRELKYVAQNIQEETLDKNHFLDNKSIKTKDEVVMIFASNKGLCGSFNTNIFKRTKKLVEENPNIKYAICFGKFAEKFAKKLNLEIVLSVLDIEKILKPSQINKYEKFIRENYLTSKWSKVHAVYTSFIKMGIFEPKNQNLYPLPKKDIISEETDKAKKIYLFEPSTNEILETVIPKIVKILIFSFILESRASENSARSFAMKRANESAGELLGTLKIKYNKVRQDSITQEIAEISAGANAI